MATASQRLIALIAASVVLVAAVVGLVMNAGDDEATVVAGPSPTVTVTDAPRKTKKPAKTRAPAPPVAPVSTPQPAPAATEPPSGPAADGTPPKPGAYTYDVTSNGEESEATLRISDGGSGRQTEATDDGRAEVEWREDGKYIVSMEFGGIRCYWEPDILEIKFPLRDGSSWSFNGRCEPFQGFELSFKGSQKVSGTERRTVGGDAVDVWVFQFEGSISGTGPEGSFEMKVTGSDRFAPSHGLSVYSREKSEGTDPSTGERMNETATHTLKSLQPQ